MNHILRGATWLLGAALFSGCSDFSDSLTGHARLAVEAAGYNLSSSELADLLASSSIPDSALTAHWAGQTARLWADYVVLAVLYMNPDTTEALDFDRLLEDQRYLAATAVLQYRDSVVLRGIEPEEEELRAYYEDRQPFTRLDVRRIVLDVPADADGAVRDSLRRLGENIRAGLAGGGDFLETARAVSHEPLEARGQLLTYQGHSDFPAVADSLLFQLPPGAVSPLIETPEAFYIYGLERRRAPDYEAARDVVYRQMLEERRGQRTRGTLDSLLDNARRSIPDGAVERARQVAAEEAAGAGSVRRGIRLAVWEGGAFTVEELRQLFTVRSDIRERFLRGSDEDIHYFLMQLARDEILTAAAYASGQVPTEEQRSEMTTYVAAQLAAVAMRMDLSYALVTNPRYEVRLESLAFLERTLHEAVPVPWLGQFRVVLDQEYGVRVHEGGAETAARKALELRAARADRGHLDEGQPPAVDSKPIDGE